MEPEVELLGGWVVATPSLLNTTIYRVWSLVWERLDRAHEKGGNPHMSVCILALPTTQLTFSIFLSCAKQEFYLKHSTREGTSL